MDRTGICRLQISKKDVALILRITRKYFQNSRFQRFDQSNHSHNTHWVIIRMRPLSVQVMISIVTVSESVTNFLFGTRPQSFVNILVRGMPHKRYN